MLVIGDVMIDQYMFGEVYRNSPEADIPVLENVTIQSKLGGAANVAMNIKSLGADVHLLSLIGKDQNANKLKDLLHDSMIPYHLLEDEKRPTTVKTRVFQGKNQLIRIDQESTEDISIELIHEFQKLYFELLQKYQANIIILQDYNKGLLTEKNIPYIIELAKDKGIFVSVDPKKKNFLAFKGVDLFKPNLKELILQSQEKYNESISNSILLKEIQKLNQHISAKTFMVTMSDRGAMIYENGESNYEKAEQIDVVDVCGAGDAVISIASLLKYKGYDNKEILTYCNKSGKIVCQKTGVAGISIEELL